MSEQKKFYEKAEETAEYIMNTSPWDEFSDTVKIYAYGTVSEESGVRGSDASSLEEANADTRKTYFGTSFWTGGMQRLLAPGEEGTKKISELKEELRKAFSKGSHVTKLFFQTYADEFFASESGKDMKEYFIIRKGGNETTGNMVGDALQLVYKDAEGNVLDELPSLAGTYTIEAPFAGNEIYDACTLTAEYTIELRDFVEFDVTSKVYDGTPAMSFT